MGGGFAIVERYQHWRTPSWFLAVATLPLFLPGLVVGTSFIHVFGNAGDLNTVLAWLELPKLQILYQPSAVILGHLYYNVPLAYLAVRTILQSSSSHLESSATVLGANRWQILSTVWWPQLRSSMFGMVIVIFLYCWTSFALPLQLGGSQAKTIEVWLYEQLTLYHRPQLAFAVALIQLLLFLIPLLLGWQQLSINQLHLPTPQSRQRFQPYLLPAALWLVPLVSLVSHTALNLNATVWSQFIQSQFLSSLFTVAILTLSCLLVVTIITHLLRISARWFMMLLAISPVALAGIWLVVLGQGLLSLGLAYVLGLLPLTYYFIQERRNRYGTQYRNAAQTLGANWWQQQLLMWRWLQPARATIIALTIIFIIGDITFSSQLSPIAYPTPMQVAFNLLSSYRWQAGQLIISMILIITISAQISIYARNSKFKS